MSSHEWPELPFDEWENTCDTLHLWTQIAGKTRMVLTPLDNHFWNVAYQVTPRGLTTTTVHCGQGSFDAEFDLLSHALTLRTEAGRKHAIRLYPRSVADFYVEFMAALHSLGFDVRINKTPSEFDDTTPFDEDRHHASYDTHCIERFHRILVGCDAILKKFRSRFIGKSSPVHFFWGSFDLAVTRFSGRRAPVRDGADSITREAYSHEVSSCGFWPGDRRFRAAAFYAYSVPAPEGFDRTRVQPGQAYWDAKLGEFLLKYDDVRQAASPEKAVLDFCQSTYEAGANLAKWDRASLERASVSEMTPQLRT